MSVTKERKTEVIAQHARAKKDTGSSEVQIAILTERVQNLTDHMKINKKDFHSRRGLLHMVAKRRKLLDYLKNTNSDRYEDILKALELRR